jgi:hypothetical protein
VGLIELRVMAHHNHAIENSGEIGDELLSGRSEGGDRPW